MKKRFCLILAAVLLLANSLISVFICMMLHESKGTVFTLMAQYGLMCFYVIKMMITDDEFGGASDSTLSRVFDAIGRFFAQGHTNSLTLLSAPDKPWLSVVCSVGLAAVLSVLGLRVFDKADLK